MLKLFDTHQHLILNDLWSYSWTENVPELKGKHFGLAGYLEQSAAAGITNTLIVENTPDAPFNRHETQHALQLCDSLDTIVRGTIAYCEPESETFREFIEEVEHPKLLGFRRAFNLYDDSILECASFRANLKILGDLHLSFDMCFLERQLPAALSLAAACPNTQFILNHCGMPDIANGEFTNWHRSMSELAEQANICCKISGLISLCPRDFPILETVRPYVEESINLFGWDRILWGSNWPYCSLATSLSEWTDITREIVSGETESNQEKLFSGNAQRIYRVKASGPSKTRPKFPGRESAKSNP